ncbi:hypothetical protein M406DRAFT_332100 [Cryphonectria parasitica EP155]|uniref:Uncharacterized protein n=1 Tax=Cryphonectria parasitica (strain ATCC 38755 / EP155) TaxID=660469 RepID=A0A9P4XZH1_CRYP1|nr:uncharacterized protein M406DRAFT_332100 [Cryphonectria parasitica EP155]KAF3763630.1 hypothetical protein M406DRAFT_332100 [Cryphonectria parasitica EP155]
MTNARGQSTSWSEKGGVCRRKFIRPESGLAPQKPLGSGEGSPEAVSSVLDERMFARLKTIERFCLPGGLLYVHFTVCVMLDYKDETFTLRKRVLMLLRPPPTVLEDINSLLEPMFALQVLLQAIAALGIRIGSLLSVAELRIPHRKDDVPRPFPVSREWSPLSAVA